VFISYSTGGDGGKFVHDTVEQLYQDLSANCCQAWMFERESVGGTQFQDQYKQAIKDSDAFILFCNVPARNSIYIEEEIKTARQQAKPIIQVLLDRNGPHPLLKEESLTPIPYNDSDRHNRVYLLSHILKAIGIPVIAAPGDTFRALGLLWKVYHRDQMYYPICNQDSIRLLASESSRMEIQTEVDFMHASLKLQAEAKWKTDTSIGFEKWYGGERYSIALQNGYVWIRGQGAWLRRSKSYKIGDWQQIRSKKLIELEIDWNKFETNISVNNLQICRLKSQVEKPLNLRLCADFGDYLVLDNLSLSNS
jgi:hypothetical protein